MSNDILFVYTEWQYLKYFTITSAKNTIYKKNAVGRLPGERMIVIGVLHTPERIFLVYVYNFIETINTFFTKAILNKASM